jgi:hypothetical protein
MDMQDTSMPRSAGAQRAAGESPDSRDLRLSLAACQRAIDTLSAEIDAEGERKAAIDREFQESASYKLGSRLCPRSR